MTSDRDLTVDGWWSRLAELADTQIVKFEWPDDGMWSAPARIVGVTRGRWWCVQDYDRDGGVQVIQRPVPPGAGAVVDVLYATSDITWRTHAGCVARWAGIITWSNVANVQRYVSADLVRAVRITGDTTHSLRAAVESTHHMMHALGAPAAP